MRPLLLQIIASWCLLLALSHLALSLNLEAISSFNVSSPVDFDVCALYPFIASSSALTDNFYAQVYSSSFPQSSGVALNVSQSTTAAVGAVKVVRYSSGVAYVYSNRANGGSFFIDAQPIGSSSVNSVTVPNRVNALLLDSDFPLLYFAGVDVVGVLDISQPSSPKVLKLWTPSSTVSHNLLIVSGPTGLAVVRTLLCTANSLANPTLVGSVACFDVSDPSSTLKMVRNFGHTIPNTPASAARADPSGKYFAVSSANALYLMQHTYPNSLVKKITSLGNVSDIAFLTPYILASSTAGVSFSFLNYTTLESLNSSVSGFTQSRPAQSMRWRNGTLYVATPTENRVRTLRLSDSSVDPMANARSDEGSCNRTEIDTANATFDNAVPLVIDARNIRPVSPLQMSAYFGSNRKLSWANVTYNVVSVIPKFSNYTGDRFQLYSNISNSWSDTQSFSQSDIDSGAVRFMAPSDYLALCRTNGNPKAYTGDITATIKDGWNRSLANAKISYAVLCCPNATQTAWNTLSISEIEFDVYNTPNKACSVPLPGYYYDTLKGSASACPPGTFKPFLGSGSAREVCQSCPDGSTTTSAASTSFSACNISAAYIAGPWYLSTPAGGSANYSYTPQVNLIPNGGATSKPLLILASVKANQSFTLGFSASLQSNGTLSGGAITQVVYGSNGNRQSLIYDLLQTGSGIVSSNWLSNEFFITVWAYYYNGYTVAGVVPYGVDPKTDFQFLKNELLLKLLQQNDTAITQDAYSGLSYRYTRRSISSVVFGSLGPLNATLKDVWSVQVTDLVNDFDVTNNATTFSYTFTSTNVASMLYSLMPNLTVVWKVNGSPVSWIDSKRDVFDFSVDTDYIGKFFDIYNTNGFTDRAKWTQTTLVSKADLNANKVYLRARTSQAFFPNKTGSAFIKFRALNPAIRVPSTLIRGFLVNLSKPVEGNAWQLGSWNFTNAVTYPKNSLYYGAVGNFSAEFNPGSRISPAVARSQNIVYLYGGKGYNAYSNTFGPDDLWAYNVDTGLFSILKTPQSLTSDAIMYSTSAEAQSNTPGKREAATMAVEGNYLYLYGPVSGSIFCDTWRFNLLSYMWLRLNNPICSGNSFTPGAYGQLIRVVNSVAYVYDPFLQSQTFKLNVSTTGNSWQALEKFSDNSGNVDTLINSVWNRGKYRFAGVSSLRDSIYVYGGFDSTNFYNSLYKFNTTSESSSLLLPNLVPYSLADLSFRETSSSLPALVYSSVAVDASGNVYVIGGYQNSPTMQSSSNALFQYQGSTSQVIWLTGSVVTGTGSAEFTSVGALQIPSYASSPNPCPGSPGNLWITSVSSDGSYYKLSTLSSEPGFGSGVFEIELYNILQTPEIHNQVYAANFWPTGCVPVNTSLIDVYAYGANDSSVTVKMQSSNNMTVWDRYTMTATTQFTFADVINGTRLLLCVSNPSGVVGKVLTESLFIAYNGLNKTGSVQALASCTGANVDPNLCSCTFGSFLNGSVCSACPADEYGSSIGLLQCARCPTGSSTFGSVGGTSLSSCTALSGWYRQDLETYVCDAGFELVAGNCVPCSADFYKSTKSSLNCSACPIGTSTSSVTGAVNVESCLAKPTFACTNSTYCACGAGSYYNVSADECSACPENTYKDHLSLDHHCDSCPIGSYTNGVNGSTSSDGCVVRPSFVVVDGSILNIGCPTGTSLSNDTTSCVSCEADTFKDSVSLGACTRCPSGTTTFNRTGFTFSCLSTSMYLMVNSTLVCEVGSTESNGWCVPCAADSYKSWVGNESCALCPTGKSTNGANGSTQAAYCATVSANDQSASVSGGSRVSLSLVIGAATGGVVLLALILVGLIYYQTKAKKTQSSVAIKSMADELSPVTESPRLGEEKLAIEKFKGLRTVYTSSMSRGLESGNLSTMQINLGSSHTVSIKRPPVTRTVAGPSRTAFAPDQVAMAFPGFLLVNSSTGFKLDNLIAEGGFARLYSGELYDTSVVNRQSTKSEGDALGKKVAIKVFKLPQGASQEMLDEQKDDLENEATVMYALACLPNIAKLYAVSEEPERALVMKLYDDSLTNLIHQSINPIRDLALESCDNSWIVLATRLAIDLLSGITCMHVMNICHLDIKPPNMLLEVKQGAEATGHLPVRLVVADFGLARFSSDMLACKRISRKLTTGLSLPYAAPEAFTIINMLSKDLAVSRGAFIGLDSYSTAVTIWEIFSRKKPLLDVPMADIERALWEGKKPNLDDLPVPANKYERTLLTQMREFMEEGWDSRVETRLKVQDMLEILKDDEVFAEL